MKRVTMAALNTKNYYAPAVYLLRDYALRDEDIRSHYRFTIIDPGIIFARQRRSYRITVPELMQDLVRVLRRRRPREVMRWAKRQLKYSGRVINVVMETLWWLAFVRVAATRPDIVSFSCYIWNVTQTLRMAALLKRLFPGIVVVLGGQEVTNTGMEFVRDHPAVDFVVDGEGEESYHALLRQLMSREPREVKNVPGLIGRSDDRAEKRMLLDDLESIPSLFSIFRHDPRRLQKIGRSRLGYMVETARGCPFKCAFCFESDKFRTVRFFPLERIADEIIGMSFLGIRKFHILDPVLCNSDHERLRQLAGIIRRANGAGNAEFSVEVYAELLKEDMFDSLDVFSSFDVGLQSYNPAVLKRINRYFNEEKFLHGLALLRERGKYYAVYLIYGLPGETLFSFMKTLRFVIGLQPPQLYINHLCVLRGTPLRNAAEQERIVFDPWPPYLVRSTGTMTAGDVVKCTILCESLTKEFTASIRRLIHA